MAEHVILFAGPMGAGKSTAVQTLSEIEVVSTEASNTERDVVDKPTTTVALDYGEITLDDDDKVRLYGVPGQKRFDFMWTILKERARGLVILVANDGHEPIAEVIGYLDEFSELVDAGRAVVGITRTDRSPLPDADDYVDAILAARPGTMIPVLTLDPRDAAQATTLLLTLVAMIDSRDAATAAPTEVTP